MPFWLIALLTISVTVVGGGAYMLLGGSDSSAKSDFWTPEVCNERLEADVEDFEEYQKVIGENQKILDAAERRGDSKSASEVRKFIADGKANIASLLKTVDEEIIPDCGRDVFRPELLEKVEAARKFLNDGSVPQAQEEGMPDVRVTSIKSTFIPYETDERGDCSGPYLDLVFTVTNYGAAFPRPIDIQTYEERAQRPAKELQFMTVIGELDFGGDMKKRLDFEVKGDTGVLASGTSLEIPAKIKVEHNQTHVRIKGSLEGTSFLKTGSAASPAYETEIDIPILGYLH